MTRTDSEFGVPFPGVVLPAGRWTTTGFRGRDFDWDRVFGRTAPRIVDLGCGNGRYLIGSALARPGHDHLGIDLVQAAVDYAAQRANRRGLTNVRFVTADAVAWLAPSGAEGLAPSGVEGLRRIDAIDELHIYHPQPYYEEADVAKRMLTPEFLDLAWSRMKPAGLLVLQTDNKAYWTYLLKAVEKHFVPEVVPGTWPDAPLGRTRREIIARRKGLRVWRMIARRRDTPLDVAIPRPDFDANRPRFKRR